MMDPNYDPVLEVIAHGDEALIFLSEGYDPDFVVQKARVALGEVQSVLRDWEPTFAADGLRGLQLRNRLQSLKLDLAAASATATDQIKQLQAARDRGEAPGQTYGDYITRTTAQTGRVVAQGVADAARAAAEGAGEGAANLGKYGPLAAAVVVALLLIFRR